MAVIGLLAATGTFSSSGNSPVGPGQPSALTVTDAVNGGVWARANPNLGTLPTEANRPPNGLPWIGNGEIERPICSKQGAQYPVIYATQHQRWKWWAELPDHAWIPMAAFKETMHDGPYDLPVC